MAGKNKKQDKIFVILLIIFIFAEVLFVIFIKSNTPALYVEISGANRYDLQKLLDVPENQAFAVATEQEQAEDVSDTSLININTASKETLMKLDGIGEVLATRIIEYREKNIFDTIEEIKAVKGISDGKFSKIKDKICVK